MDGDNNLFNNLTVYHVCSYHTGLTIVQRILAKVKNLETFTIFDYKKLHKC